MKKNQFYSLFTLRSLNFPHPSSLCLQHARAKYLHGQNGRPAIKAAQILKQKEPALFW